MEEELQFLDTLNGRETLYLIRQKSTGRILTGRRVAAPQRDVYEALRQQPRPMYPLSGKSGRRRMAGSWFCRTMCPVLRWKRCCSAGVPCPGNRLRRSACSFVRH